MKIRILVLAILLGAGLSAYFFWPRTQSDGELVLYGNVDIREVQLGFRVAGRLQAMHFEEGDPVSAGALLAELDSGPLQDDLALASARVDEAAARLSSLRTGSRPQEILLAQARVAEAESALDNARQEYERQKELIAKNLGSRQLLDAAVAQRDQASARLKASRETLALSVEGPRSEDIKAAEASLAGARAQFELAQSRLEDTRLLAPNNGVVLTRVREPGSIVGVGVPVYAISLTDTVYVRAYVDEPSLGRVVPGAQVTVTSDSSGKAYTGQIGFVSPRAEFTPKSVESPELRTDLVYRLRIVISDADEFLRQGMPVTIQAGPG